MIKNFKNRFRLAIIVFIAFVSQVVCQYEQVTEADLVPMSQYKGADQHFRILDCNMCFKAAGRMCHPPNYKHNLDVVQSGKSGMAVCCKPDSTDQQCETQSGQTGQICSMKSIDEGDNSKYEAVLNRGQENYQMFAFCPAINQQICGISSDSQNTDVVLKATLSQQQISTSLMKYVPSITREEYEAGKTVEYDFCHYIIKPNDNIDISKNDKGIQFKVTKKTNMVVYIYGGSDRYSATTSIIKNNDQAKEGQEYAVEAGKGMLIVAFPEQKNLATDFSFEYTITQGAEIPSEPQAGQIDERFGDKQQSNQTQNQSTTDQDGEGMSKESTAIMIASISGGIILIIIVAATGILCMRKLKDQTTKIQAMEMMQTDTTSDISKPNLTSNDANLATIDLDDKPHNYFHHQQHGQENSIGTANDYFK